MSTIWVSGVWSGILGGVDNHLGWKGAVMTSASVAAPPTTSPTAPPTGSPPSRWLRRIGRWLLICLAVLGCVAGTGMTYQAIATAADRRTTVPAGRLVHVGGRAMHLHCTGAGAPTVVLESGAGAPSSMWSRVQPAVSQQTRVCAYDRAGVGSSDPGSGPRDAAGVARDLHALLRAAGEEGPYVLAGHSLGGQYALRFAQLYGPDTAGVVLIDAQHPDTTYRLPTAQAMGKQQQQQISLLVVLSRLGIVRLFNLAPADPRFPAEAQQALNMTKNSTEAALALSAEMRELPANREQLRAAGNIGSTPLTVLSATEHGLPELESYTLGLQGELAALSTNGKHEIATGTDHMSLVSDPHDALRTIAVIGAAVEQARGR
jgi:pimeloyl-ACP methyl ester carboxylesterase